MRRILKLLHTIGAIGLTGSMAALLVMTVYAPAPGAGEPSALAEYARYRAAMSGVATYLFFPSLGLTILSGLVSLSLNRAWVDQGWALGKLGVGLLMFEGGLIAIAGAMRKEAELSAQAVRGDVGAGELGAWLDKEPMVLVFLIAISLIAVALGIWRPRAFWK
ncbi:MAG: hypothetical protein NW205_01985 [Hyphomicrobiaceae bacterium]|nr:hypothetical protein [Hyphomicrobiaceae bacterium]